MKQLDMLTRQKRKDYTAPALLGVSFVCEKGFATSFKSTDGPGTGSSTGSQMQDFNVQDGSSQMYF